MKNKNLRVSLASLSLFSMLLATTYSVNAAPIKFSQVKQIVSAKPGKANTGNFAQLSLVKDDNLVNANDGDGKDQPKTAATPPPGGRVITETRSDIIEDEACDCIQPTSPGGGFPKFALLGLAAIPIGFLIFRRRDRDTPTPTPTTTTTPTSTPTSTPTTTPTVTPTPCIPGNPVCQNTPPPCDSCTPTPTPTITPTPEPVPEPITILLFGTGLAGIGVAARRRFRRKSEEEEESEEQN